MGLRIAKDNGIASRGMTIRAVAVHPNHGAVVYCGMIADKGAMTGYAIVRAAPHARRRADEDAGCPMTLPAAVVNLVVCGAEGDAGHTACGPGMTIGAVRGQCHPIRVIGSAVLGGKNTMTGIAFSTAAFTNRNRH